MRCARLLFLLVFVLSGYAGMAQNYFLVPESFFLQKGAKLDMHILSSDDFGKPYDVTYQPKKTAKFILIEGKKQTNIAATVKDTTSVVSYTPTESGLALLSVASTSASNEMSRAKFLRSIDPEDPDKIGEKVKNGNQLYYKEKYTSYMKTLVQVDKPSSGTFTKPVNDDLEIILQQNPYKGSYGDDITAVVNFKGKPIVNAPVILFVKTAGGNVFPQKLSTDASGLVYFKLSREGVYALRVLHTKAATDKAADFETWRATYTFAFSSNNEMPNTYKEFGFGNKH